MSYVAISGQVMEKVVAEARASPEEQVVGVLLGRQSGDTIIIEDAATGPAESDSARATLTGDSIAKIADDIVSNRIRGSIVGWYHSHVRGGVFMSETDVETQIKLQQFSPLVTAMVIDVNSGRSGFFRADPRTKGAMPVPVETARQMAIPTPTPSPTTQQAMYPQGPMPTQPSPSISTRTILLSVLLITLAITAGIVALIYYRGPLAESSGNLALTHTPPKGPFTIGNPITFDANATGNNLNNVTLSFRMIEKAPTSAGVIVGSLRTVPMLLKAAGKDTYSYTLAPSEVSGVYVQYYITAFDDASPPDFIRSDDYTLNVGDFDWQNDQTEVTAIRNVQSSVSLRLVSINGFAKPVAIRVATSPPLGVLVSVGTPQVLPPNSALLTIASTDNAQITRKYSIEIDALYTVAAIQILRRTTLLLTITDFSIDVTPVYLKGERCSALRCLEDVSYSVKIVVFDGFTAPGGIKISVIGLPEKTTWELVAVDHKIAADGAETIIYNLRIHAETGAKLDKYLFEVRATAYLATTSMSHGVANLQYEIFD